MKKIFLPALLCTALALTGCETAPTMNKQTVGTGAGAVIGGILGSKVGKGSGQLWATGAGALLGALVGSEIGKSLDKADMMYLNRAQTQAHSAPVGQTISWENPDTGHGGTFTPTKVGTEQTTNRYCREYKQTIVIDGREEVGVGQACQNPDGTWDIM